MENSSVLNLVWIFCNSGMGTALAWMVLLGVFYWLTSKYNPFQEKWKAYEGTIITAIRLAEKQIPSDTTNAGLAKLDAALNFVLKAYAEANSGKPASTQLVEIIKQGIQIKHDEMDKDGVLG